MSNMLATRRAMMQFGAWATAAAVLPSIAAGPALAENAGAISPIEQFDIALVMAMKAGKGAPFQQRYAILLPSVDRAFDLQTILRVSVGPHWTALSADQQQQLLTSFRRYTVANFVSNFDSWQGESIQVSPQVRALPNGDQVVSTSIGKAGGSPVTLAYVMRQTSAGWKAVDVLADGSISRVAVQRSDFRSLLASGGGSALLSSLERKVSDLSGGTLA